MATKWFIFLLVAVFFSRGFQSALASPAPARIVGGIAFNVASSVFKWLWSLKSPAKSVSAASSRSLIKFEGGYNVETLFDGSKLGIEPHSVHATSTSELLILDSTNSNLYKVSTPLSPCKSDSFAYTSYSFLVSSCHMAYRHRNLHVVLDD
ncbi:hypothetical protein Dimus_011274 [Dionaea muscipula]